MEGHKRTPCSELTRLVLLLDPKTLFLEPLIGLFPADSTVSSFVQVHSKPCAQVLVVISKQSLSSI